MSGLVPPDFELSQNYTWFFHFIEQSNAHFEGLVRARDPSFDDQELRHLAAYDAIQGGHFEHFAFLANKYGLAPKEAMPETASSKNAAMLIIQ